MNEIIIFENEKFGPMRTVMDDDNKVLFCATDVARALGYANPQKAIRDHCKWGTERNVQHPQNPEKRLKMKFVPEGDVYRLITHSRLPSAEEFEVWVFDDVLPTMRNTGGYVNDADKFVNTYLPFADEPTKNLFKIQFEYINQLNDRIRRDEPKVKFADHVSDTVNLIDMNDMAKLCADHGIRIGRTRLFRWLRYKGILMEDNIPYQEYIERGYFKVKESVFEMHGEIKTYQQTMVTGRGQQYILARLMREYGTEVPNA